MYYPTVIYHLYNQTNNYETLFRTADNYHYFLRKVRKELLPVADIFCYCLMPDHFHFLLKPKPAGCLPSPSKKISTAEDERGAPAYQQAISHQIKTLLSSYTKAYNKRYRRRGSLFRAKTKAKPGYKDFIPADFEFRDNLPFTRYVPYLKTCFRYIHNNPVKADLVDQAWEWEFSSAPDYAGQRDNGICDYALTQQLLGIERLS